MLALLFLRTARHAVGAPPVGALKWVGTGVAPMMFTPPAQGRAPYERMAMRLYNRETLLSTEEGREGLLQFLLGYTTHRTSRCRYASTILQELYHGVFIMKGHFGALMILMALCCQFGMRPNVSNFGENHPNLGQNGLLSTGTLSWKSDSDLVYNYEYFHTNFHIPMNLCSLTTDPAVYNQRDTKRRFWRSACMMKGVVKESKLAAYL